jgi:hypothetical protein
MKILLKIRPATGSGIKQKVMDDINTVKFIIEVTSLFSSNYAETIEGMFKTKSKNNNDTNQ